METPVEAVFERDDGIAPYEKHMLRTLLLRPRRLSSSATELPLLRPATAPLPLHEQVFDERSQRINADVQAASNRLV